MKNRIWLSLIVIVLASAFQNSCKKEPSSLGLGLQPPGDALNVIYSDTTSITAYSQFIDSVRTDETNTSLLGSLLDPVFGLSTASFYAQYRLSNTAISFGTNPVMDSLVVSLFYSGIYGDSNAVITVKVYEMDELINIDSNYYSNQSAAIKSTLLASHTFTANLKDSVVVGTDTLAPHLRFNLSDLTTELGDKLLSASDDDLNTNDNFLNYFNGLYFTAEAATSGGAIVSFNLLSSISRMSLYYRNDANDSLRFDYFVNANSARFGHFDHDYSLGDPSFQAQLINGDTTLGTDKCYLQSMAGIKTRLKFPHLDNYYDDGRVAINEARIFLTIADEEDWIRPPLVLTMVRSDGAGGYVLLEDQFEGLDYFGGIYDEDKKQYWFRITKSIQAILKSEVPDNGFEIYISGGSLNADRAIIAGTSPGGDIPPESRMKLVITYTMLK